MPSYIERKHVVALIADAVKTGGGSARFSRTYDIQEPYVLNVLSGRTAPQKRICAVVGVQVDGDGKWRVVR